MTMLCLLFSIWAAANLVCMALLVWCFWPAREPLWPSSDVGGLR